LLLKNKAEVNLFKNLHSFKVAEASDLISWWFKKQLWTLGFCG
jgi:hypothetical protein